MCPGSCLDLDAVGHLTLTVKLSDNFNDSAIAGIVGYHENALPVPLFKPGKHGDKWPLLGASHTVRRIACLGKQLHVHPGRENHRALTSFGQAQDLLRSDPFGIDGVNTGIKTGQSPV